MHVNSRLIGVRLRRIVDSKKSVDNISHSIFIAEYA